MSSKAKKDGADRKKADHLSVFPRMPWALCTSVEDRCDSMGRQAARGPLRHEDRRGAALVIVIAIMAILLAIALTFFRITSEESQVATNVSNTVRVDLLSDAAIAIAIAQLNQDVLRHPGATSLDHPWRSTFNGAWVVGKPWALAKDLNGNAVPLQAGGVPEINLNSMPDIVFSDKWREPLYRGPRTRGWLFIPRIEGDTPVIYAPVGEYALIDPVTGDDLTATFPHGTFPIDGAGNIDRTRGDYRRFVTAAIHSTVDGGVGDGYPAEQVDSWADVDNDGDGLRDSLWIPIPIDKMLTVDHYTDLWGLDNDLDGRVGGFDLDGDNKDDDPNEAGPFVYWGGADGLDNDGDGLIDEADFVSTPQSPTVEYDPRFDDPDNPPGTLPPGGTNYGFFLTTPLPGLTIPIDADGDGIPGNEDLNGDGFDDQMEVVLPSPIFVTLLNRGGGPFITLRMTAEYVDTIDNDYDLIANDYFTYAYLANQVSAPPRFAYSEIAVGDFPDGKPFVINRNDLIIRSTNAAQVANLDTADLNALVNAYRANIRITHSGEPVCDLAGRAAVLITDEAGKVNINSAGGHYFFDDGVTYPNNLFGAGTDFANVVDAVIRRSLGDGTGVYEYDTRTLPTARDQLGNFGSASARRLWSALMGAPDTDPTNFDNTLLEPYRWDCFLPGYGRADDNGNAFLECFNGRDDDGDGLVDEGIYLPPLSFWTHAYVTDSSDYQNLDNDTRNLVRNAALVELAETKFVQYFNRLGLFEGIDEPGELQRFRPLRNLLAENDTDLDNANAPADNDGDGVANEFGELGDRQFQNRQQLAAAYQLGAASVDKLLPFVTTHSTDRNVAYVDTDAGLRAINRLDLNHAPPQEIAASLMVEGEFTPITERGVSRPGNSVVSAAGIRAGALAFAEGLRQGDMNLVTPPYDGLEMGGGFLHTYNPELNTDPNVIFPSSKLFPADPQLQAMQFAVDAVDSRDSGHGRSTLTTERADLVADDIIPGFDIPDPWPRPGDLNAREAIPAEALMPLEEVQEYARKTLDIGSATGDEKRLEATDDWWRNLTLHPETAADGTPVNVYEERHISYTTTGVEAIRINELMVRPVRRVEAEMESGTNSLLDPAPAILGLDGVMPEFGFQRASTPSPGGTPPDTPWTLFGNGVLGSGSGLVERANSGFAGYNVGGGTVPDIAQFIFTATDPSDTVPDGLPPGRYYLTMKGAVDGQAPGTADGQVHYSIKYVDVANGGPTILDDVAAGLPGYALANWQFLPGAHTASRPGERAGWMFFDGTPLVDPLNGDKPAPSLGYFSEWPPAASFLMVDNPAAPNVSAWGRVWLSDPFTDANLDGLDDVTFESITVEFMPFDLASSGNVTLNDTASAFSVAVPMGAATRFTYNDADPSFWAGLRTAFLDGTLQASVSGLDAGNNPVVLLGTARNDPQAHRSPYPDYTTNTVSIPRPESGFALCVAIENPVPGQELAIDFFEFSQEPDHEYIELVNISDEPVDVSGWELEVGIPDRDGVLPDPFKSLWKVPDGTVAAPKGRLLLSFDGNRNQTAESKFDRYHAPLGQGKVNKIASNGIGLAAGGVFGGDAITNFLDIMDITVPPILDMSRTYDPAGPTDLRQFYDPTGSVFDRRDVVNTEGFSLYRDYVDNNGDGVTTAPYVVPQRDALLDQNMPADPNDFAWAQLARDLNTLAEIDSDHVLAEDEQLSTRGGATSSGSKPWDRIVPLRSIQLELDPADSPWDPGAARQTLYQVTSVDDVARLVLRGGVLPNYPEHDGIDNDGDGGYFTSDGGDYVRGTLEKDMIDNDMDGLIDETSISTGPPVVIDLDPLLSEGVDEGRQLLGRNYGAGSFEPGTVPIRFFDDRATHENLLFQLDQVDGKPEDILVKLFGGGSPVDILPFGVMAMGGKYAFGVQALPDIAASEESPQGVRTLGYNTPYVNGVIEEPEIAPYLGSDADPPDWKAFVERRWYPGDNVIVTLYEGQASEGKVADRVTYRELDVTNRTVDDIAPNPYFVDSNGNGVYDSGDGAYFGLNPNYPSLWAPDQMGLDFYRSLERKSPLYNGDRFGTENRWQATDGNYDDWSDSLSWFEQWLETDPNAAQPTRWVRADQANTDIPFTTGRLASINTDLGKRFNARLFGHAMAGSPLRMNTAERLSENPKDLIKTLDIDVALGFSDPDFNLRRDDQFPGLEDNPDWSAAKAVVKDRPFESPGELTRLSHFVITHTMVNTSDVAAPLFRRVLDSTQLNLPFIWPGANPVVTPQDTRFTHEVALLGQDEFDSVERGNMLTHAVDMTALENTILTVAQADFTPINPGMVSRSTDAFNFDPDWLEWGLQPNLGAVVSAPVAWTPVFLFAMAGDNTLPYPSFPDGRSPGLNIDPVPLFNIDYQGNMVGDPFFAGMFTDEMAARWPLGKRTVMYVAENDGSTDPGEALFTWDGADGLENGEYILYIGTFTPDLAKRLDTARDAIGNVAQQELVNAGVLAVPPNEDFTFFDNRTESLLSMDPALTPPGNRRYDPQLAVQVITDPASASGVVWPADDPSWNSATERRNSIGLPHPDSWFTDKSSALPVGPDGYIFYGNSLWQPIPVKVRDNFLALRIRNVGDPGQVAVVSHVVLAPRKRVPGRINVNTVADRTPQRDDDKELWNALLGLPALVNLPEEIDPPAQLNEFGIAYDDLPGPALAYDAHLGLLDAVSPANDAFRPRPGRDPDFDPGTLPSFMTNWPVPLRRYLNRKPLLLPAIQGEGGGSQAVIAPDYLLFGEEWLTRPTGMTVSDFREVRRRYAAQRLANLMTYGRAEHVDGRYYEKVSDLARDASGFVPPQVEAEYFREGYASLRTNARDLAVYPLSNEGDSERRFDEVAERFRRMANLVTTRSDVFEIIVTVQAGYGVDANGDGRYNYRSADEFVVTAENKTRLVYERRSPSDQSGRPRD